jgi:hypothetical protein
MTPHQILIVGIRLLVILWLLNIFGQVASGLAAAVHVGEELMLWARLTWVSIGIQVAVCALLWFFPATLASKLLRGGDVPVVSASIPFSEWRDLCFVTVGIFVLASAIPNMIYWVVFVGSVEPFGPDLDPEQKAIAFSNLFELLIGLALTLGARKFGTFLQRARSVDVPTGGSGAQGKEP